LALEDELCDVEVRNCRTPVYTWEHTCDTCGGSGTVVSYTGSRKKARRRLATCLACSGLGVVRSASARFIPDPNG
jgi:DnaJ-class molecular chaperone